MKVAVVILNWNTIDYLRRFLPPLLESVALFNAGGDSGGDSNGTSDGVSDESLDGISDEVLGEVLGEVSDGVSGSISGNISDGECGEARAGVTGPGLQEASADSAEVVVADSGSTDGSMEMLAAEFPSVRRIPLGRNYGFTGGYNRALKDPETCSCDLFVLLNSDMEVTRNWLRPLVEWMKSHPSCGACGPKLHSWYERDKFEYAGAAGGLIDRFGYPFCRGRVMGRVETDRGQYDAPADVLWVTGACLAVRADVWRSLGGLDDRFFAHMEEIDLCWKMQLAGWKVTVVPESVVFHLGGGTLPQNSPQKLYLNFRNNLLLLDNNLARTIGRKRAKLRILLRKILDGGSAAVYLLTLRPRCFKAVWRAHRDAARLISEKDRAAGTGRAVRFHAPEEHGNGRKAHGTAEGRVAGMYGGCIILRALFGLGAGNNNH